MELVNTILIGVSPNAEVLYQASYNKTHDGIVISRIYNIDKYNERRQIMTSFLDGNTCFYTCVVVGDNQYALTARTPYRVYKSQLPPECSMCNNYCMECRTSYGHTFRAHIDGVNEEGTICHQIIVTVVNDENEDEELVIATVDVLPDSECDVIVSGYSAEFECEDF